MQNINVSALNVLKTEILRRKEIAEKVKNPIETHRIRPLPKSSEDSSEKNENSSLKKIAQLTVEEREKAKKSRDILEAKAKLYESLSEGAHLVKGSNLYLVNFEQKAAEEEGSTSNSGVITDATEKIKLEKTIEEFSNEIKSEGTNEESKDLSKISDKELIEEARKLFNSENHEKKNAKSEATLVSELNSAYLHLEKMHQKWEEEERLARSKDDVHYQDILFDEIRTHGAGYFAFSRDEGERRRQQAELEKIRQETLKHQEEFKRRQEGVSCEETYDEKACIENQESQVVEEELPQKELTQEELSKRIEEGLKAISRQVNVREWDKGKEIPVMSQEEWIEKKRKERDADFAPPSIYFESQTKVRKYKKQMPVASRLSLFQRKLSTKSNLEGSETVTSEEKEIKQETAKDNAIPPSSVFVHNLLNDSSSKVSKTSSNSSSNDKFCEENRLKYDVNLPGINSESETKNKAPKSAMAMLEALKTLSPDDSLSSNKRLCTDEENSSNLAVNCSTTESTPFNSHSNSNTFVKPSHFVPFSLIPKKISAKMKLDSKKATEEVSNSTIIQPVVITSSSSSNSNNSSSLISRVFKSAESCNSNILNSSSSAVKSNKFVVPLESKDREMPNVDEIPLPEAEVSSLNANVPFKSGNILLNRPRPKSGMALLEDLKKSNRNFGPDKELCNEKSRFSKGGVEIAPPECLVSESAPTPPKRRLFSTRKDVADSISVGLQNLKNVAEKKKKVKEKGLLDIL